MSDPATAAAAQSEPAPAPAQPAGWPAPPATAAAPTGPAARAVALVKTYGKGATEVRALDGVDLVFDHGRFTAVMGPSGSGKSTLMHCMAGLDRPTSGQVFIGDSEISKLDDSGLTRMRRDYVGFVFQSFNLVPTLTARENISLPADLAGRKLDPAWFDFLVTQLGIKDRLEHKPNELSGGQQQRVACARALAARPQMIFADEPTGNLDTISSGEMLTFLRSSVTDLGQTVVMVTHDPRSAAFADNVLFLVDGKVVGSLDSPTADSVLEAVRRFGG